MKILKFLSDHILFVVALFFLVFIPLYPKLPLFDVEHTWVYIRLEDLLVAVAGIIFLVQLIRRKATLKTPLTIPILLFLVVGLISTVHAIFFIFPNLADVFPNVAFLHYLRRIEYLSVFFIGFAAMRQKRFTNIIAAVLLITLIVVVLYGLGQRGFLIGWENRFPAFSTMNEEFAKGVPLKLSALARISSTFAGHYDLAAYLVMLIPIMGSFVFGYKKWYLKIVFFLSAVSGLVILLLTSSRVSFAVYLLTVIFMILLQKVRPLYKTIIVVAVVIGSVMLMNMFQGISSRFASTISQVDVVVDARTGKPIGIATTETDNTGKKIVIDEKTPTGEDLPQGSGYINIPTTDEGESVSKVTYKKRQVRAGNETTEVTNIEGDFVIKKVLAYDLSFTTRFQGTWPRAWEAFSRNYFLGSGYSSISLATDNNYLRILGEVGLLGFLTYLGIFLVFGIYVYKILPSVTDKSARALIIGVIAALFGVGLNAVLIDVFEASKVAFVMWMLLGLTVGLLQLYKKEKIHYLKETIKVFTSTPAIGVYLLALVIGFYGSTISHFFVGDDFTWLRWAADCKRALFSDGLTRCEEFQRVFLNYFTNADGFFYRPGTKMYFHLMYPIFSLNQHAYHVVSLALHWVVTFFIFLIAAKILTSRLFALTTAVMFVILSAHSEAVLWVSATGHLITFASMLAALLFFIYWRETKHLLYFFLTIPFLLIAPLFHEMGIVGPFLLLGYDLISHAKDIRKSILSRWFYLIYLVIVPLYFILRTNAGSHWMSGDYNYNLIKLPFNILGNLVGYVMLTFGGARSYPFYDALRTFAREHTSTVWLVLLVVVFSLFLLYWLKLKDTNVKTKKTLLLIAMLFVFPLLPFIGLGNIAYRYGYFASFGLLLFASYLLMHLYEHVRRYGKVFALGFALLPVITFSLWQTVELQKIQSDWKVAGMKSEQILVTFNEVYAITKGFSPNPVFYFVNTPIKTGEAWIFPVGLDDALWFTFQNENLTVHEVSSLDVAFDFSEGSASAKVFEFDNNGNVSEVTVLTPTPTP